MILLASHSPRRSLILNDFNVPFKAIPNLLTEEPSYSGSEGSFIDYVAGLSKLKAMESRANHQGVILGCDTIVVKDDKVFGKPRHLEEAADFLRELSGDSHSVFSAFTLLDTQTDSLETYTSKADVEIPDLSDQQIKDYINQYDVLDKAGGYGIQDLGQDTSISVDGSRHVVIGLDIHKLVEVLATDYGFQLEQS